MSSYIVTQEGNERTCEEDEIEQRQQAEIQ
jgi:hypothetical protein